MAASLRVTTVDSVRKVPKEAWNALIKGAPPVNRWEWLDALESSDSAVPKRGWQACHFLAWRGENLVGLSPAWLKGHSMGEYIYDFGWANAASSFGVSYYPKLLVGVPLSPLTSRRFHIAQGDDASEMRGAMVKAMLALAKECSLSSMHVIFPLEEEVQALTELGFFHRVSMQYHWKNRGYRTYDDYLSRFDSKRRNQLKRERAAAAAQGIALETVRGASVKPEHAELAYRFYQNTVEKNGWGQVQLTQDFFARVFATLPEHVELVLATRQGKPIAGAFNLSSPARLYGRYWGCFEEHPFLHFNVCLYHSIDDCIVRELEAFEPGAGGEHKISRGFEPTAVHSVHRIFDSAFERAVKDAVRRETAHLAPVLAKAETIAGMKPLPVEEP
jgi:predicted N-acyltransferase